MRPDNIAMLQDTLEIFERGFYEIDGRKVQLKLTPEERKAAQVYLPKDVRRIEEAEGLGRAASKPGRCSYRCLNMDSFSLARKVKEGLPKEDQKPVLVLNFANPVIRGGGVRKRRPGWTRRSGPGRICWERS